MSDRRHDEDAFIRFASESAPTLLRAAQLLLGAGAAGTTAEDAVQTTLVRVWEHWERAEENPAAYSRTVLLNVCRDHWRRSGRRPDSGPALASEDRPAESPSLFESVEDRALLDDLLRDLSEQQREILVLRFYLDMSVAETGAALGLPEGTVKSYTSRALAAVRQAISTRPQEPERCSPTNN